MSEVTAGKTTVGWREWVTLPELPLGPIMAKIDTGAQTSALHATDIVEVTLKDGQRGVQFRVYPDHMVVDNFRQVTAVLHDVRQVRNSGGIHSMRMVIRTQLRIGNDIVLNPEVTLIERRIMRYPMLIGRTALRKACALVDSHQSWLHGGGG